MGQSTPDAVYGLAARDHYLGRIPLPTVTTVASLGGVFECMGQKGRRLAIGIRIRRCCIVRLSIETWNQTAASRSLSSNYSSTSGFFLPQRPHHPNCGFLSMLGHMHGPLRLNRVDLVDEPYQSRIGLRRGLFENLFTRSFPIRCGRRLIAVDILGNWGCLFFAPSIGHVTLSADPSAAHCRTSEAISFKYA